MTAVVLLSQSIRRSSIFVILIVLQWLQVAACTADDPRHRFVIYNDASIIFQN